MSEGQGDEGVKRMLSKNVRESRSIFTGQILGGLHRVGEGGGGGDTELQITKVWIKLHQL